MAGLADLIFVRIALDAILTDSQVFIGRHALAVGRMDVPFTIRLEPGGNSATVDRPVALEDCADVIESIYVTTAAAVAGGVIELWCSNPAGSAPGGNTGVSFP